MRTLERTVEEQRDAIAVLSTPLIEVWHGILEVPIVGRLDASRAALLCDALFPALRAKRTSRVILDLTGVTDFEVSAVDGFAEIVRAVRLLGVETFVVGIRPTLAGTLVQLDVRFEGTRVFGTLALALRHCLLETESI
jgi:rsbT co-antagonist protein RsbR